LKIELSSVSVTYEEGMPSATRALSGVDLTLVEGECVAVVGPAGSGKTTLLEVIAGLTRPSSGRIAGSPDGSAASLRTSVGLVHQFPEAQFFEETVFEDVAFGPNRQGLEPAEVRDRVSAALTRAGLPPEEFGERAPLSLSAGEKRRGAIAAILALGRPFLLLDEPTAGLDPATRRRVADLIENEVATGRGVAIVTHDLALAAELASRTIVMSEGSILADRGTASVFCDDALLGRIGLEPPPRYALVCRLRRENPAMAEEIGRLLGAPLAEPGA
jgi:energy-coupling factor transport system ATP-binding protein